MKTMQRGVRTRKSGIASQKKTAATTQTTETCSPVWKYLLLMCADLQAVAEAISTCCAPPVARCQSGYLAAQLKWLSWGIERIGKYHTDAELQPLAVFVDGMVAELVGIMTGTPDAASSRIAEYVVQLRERLEELSGWEAPAIPFTSDANA